MHRSNPREGDLSGTRLPVLGVDEVRTLTSTRWWLQRAERRELWIEYEIGSSSCDADRGVYVEETAERVLLGHYVQETRTNRVCTADLRIGRGVVHLSEPLVERSLWHVEVRVPW